MREERLVTIGLVTYQVISLFTFVYLTFFDGYVYNSWNWLIAIPVNVFLSSIWPIYWGLLRWLM